MSEQTSEEVDIQTQKTLAAIYDLTAKINKELGHIAELVGAAGRLNSTVMDANESLTNLFHDMGIDVETSLANLAGGENVEDETQNLQLPSMPDSITQKIAALVAEAEECSKKYQPA